MVRVGVGVALGCSGVRVFGRGRTLGCLGIGIGTGIGIGIGIGGADDGMPRVSRRVGLSEICWGVGVDHTRVNVIDTIMHMCRFGRVV